MSDAAPPPPGVFDRFLALIDDVARRPVLVHCEQGFHRTGLMVAAYRIGRLGWSLETAIDEMSTRGFDPTEAKRLPLVDALRRWATRGA